MKQKLLFLAFFSLFTFTTGFSQFSAKLDSSFLSVGEFWDGYLNQYQSIVASETLPDSTLVYVAQVTAGSGSSIIIKLKHDGTIDSSFGTFGKVTYTIGGNAPTVKGIELFNGKFYLSGKVNQDKFVTRMNLNGTLDNTFGVSGTRTVNYSTPIVDITNSFVMDTSGNCYVGARITSLATSTTELTVTKINSSGNVDNTFGASGRASFSLPTGAVSAFSDLAIDRSQRIIAAACGSNTGSNVVLLVKFNSNGTLYTGFNSTGYKEWTFTGADTYQVATNEIVTDNDKVIVVGEYLVSGNPNSFIFKVKSNGTYDSTFANNGLLLYNNGSYNIKFSEALLASDGGIMIAGSAGSGINSHIALLRILSNGSIDSSFATNGMFLNQVGIRWETNGADCMSIYSDDRVFLGGNSSDCDQAICYFTSSMSRVRMDSLETGGGKNDTTQTSGITEFNPNIEINIFPNPISLGQGISITTNHRIDKIEIYSLTGQRVLAIKNPEQTIPLEELSESGVYLIRFTTKNRSVTKKLVVH